MAGDTQVRTVYLVSCLRYPSHATPGHLSLIVLVLVELRLLEAPLASHLEKREVVACTALQHDTSSADRAGPMQRSSQYTACCDKARPLGALHASQ
jgi:hypothetical protein